MDLKNVIKQIQAISQELDAAQKTQERLDTFAQKLEDHYAETKAHVRVVSEQFGKMMPTALLSQVKTLNDRIAEGVRLTAEVPQIHAQYREQLVKIQELYENTAQLSAQHAIALEAASQREKHDADIIADIYDSAIEARARGEDELAAQLQQNLEFQIRSSSQASVALFEMYQQMQRFSQESRQANEVATQLHEKYMKLHSELITITEQTDAWSGAVKYVSEATSSLKKSLLFALSAGLIAYAVKGFHAVGQATLEANGHLADRLKLVKENFQISLQLGLGTEQVAKAQKALLATGQKDLATNKQRVRTISMMAAGLDVAEEDAAQLALQSDLTGNNFERVANAVSVVVTKTQLLGKEATKVATSMAQVHRVLGLSGGKLDSVTTAVGVMEGALKKLGGTGDTATKLIERFSTLKGIGDSVMFGGQNGIMRPEDFQDVDKLQKMIQSTGQRLQELTGGDPVMLNAIEPLIQRMGLTLSEARALMDMSTPEKFAEVAKNMKQANELRKQTSDLEKRYRTQVSAAGQQWQQLKNQLGALVKVALIPLLDVVTWLLTGLNKLLSVFTKFTAYVQSGTSTLSKALGLLFTSASWVISAGVVTMLAVSIVKFGKTLLTMRSGITELLSAVGTGKAKALKDLLTQLGGLKTLKIPGTTTIRGLFGSVFSALSGYARSALGTISKVGPAMLQFASRFGRLIGSMGSGLGRMLGSTAARIGGSIAGRIALPIAAVVGAAKIVQLGAESAKLYKAKKSEKAATQNLDALREKLRQKYNVPAGVDPIEYVKKLHKTQLATNAKSNSAQSEAVATKVTQAAPPAVNVDAAEAIRKSLQLPVVGSTYQARVITPQTTGTRPDTTARSNELLNQKVAELITELRAIQTAIQTGFKDQISTTIRENRTATAQARLHTENSALTTKPTTVYGLESYVP